jgi:predicted branched-subunit amino acid permease
MNTILAYLKTWFVTNWKTTVLGFVAAIEIYQKTGNLQLALTALFTGIFVSDAKTPTQAQAAATTPGS